MESGGAGRDEGDVAFLSPEIAPAASSQTLRNIGTWQADNSNDL